MEEAIRKFTKRIDNQESECNKDRRARKIRGGLVLCYLVGQGYGGKKWHRKIKLQLMDERA